MVIKSTGLAVVSNDDQYKGFNSKIRMLGEW